MPKKQSLPLTVTETKTDLLAPPSTLLKKCDLPTNVDPKHPFANMKITDDIVNGYLDWYGAANSCAARVNRLIDWYKDAPKQLDQ